MKVNSVHFLSGKKYFSEKLGVTYRTPCHASDDLVFLTLPMLLVWHYTTQWSSGTAPVLFTGCYATPVVTW